MIHNMELNASIEEKSTGCHVLCSILRYSGRALQQTRRGPPSKHITSHHITYSAGESDKIDF